MPVYKQYLFYLLTFTSCFIGLASLLITIPILLPEDDISPAQVSAVDDLIKFEGAIMEQSYNDVAALIENNPQLYKTLVITSPGGEERYAILLTELLNKNNIELTVPSLAHCGSSCVYIVLNSQKKRISYGAILHFHAGRSLGTFNLFAVAEYFGLIDDLQPTDLTEVMGIWAESYSPNLKVFFESCETNPIRTTDGIQLFWMQMEVIKQGREDFTCEELREQVPNIPYLTKKSQE